MWLHSGLPHIAMNCFMLWMFGSRSRWRGAEALLRLYLFCGIGAGVLIAIVPYVLYALGGSRARSRFRRSAPRVRSTAWSSPTRSRGPSA